MTTPAITHDDARAVARYRRAYLSGDYDWSPSPAETLATAKAISDALGLPVDEDSFEAAINPRSTR